MACAHSPSIRDIVKSSGVQGHPGQQKTLTQNKLWAGKVDLLLSVLAALADDLSPVSTQFLTTTTDPKPRALISSSDLHRQQTHMCHTRIHAGKALIAIK